jgi:glutamate/tyrosine decarboxylase-like PLP-dependent enzyme
LTIVVLQAGNVHSGAFDPFTEAITAAHDHGAWVHVDGAFGLWAAASPSYRHLVTGCEAADSWATDAHKTLNVPTTPASPSFAMPLLCARRWVCTART